MLNAESDGGFGFGKDWERLSIAEKSGLWDSAAFNPIETFYSSNIRVWRCLT